MVDDEVIALKPPGGSVYREGLDGGHVVGLVQGKGFTRPIGPVPQHLEPGLLVGQQCDPGPPVGGLAGVRAQAVTMPVSGSTAMWAL